MADVIRGQMSLETHIDTSTEMSYLLELVITLGVWIALKQVDSVKAMKPEKAGLLVLARKSEPVPHKLVN